MRPQTTAVAVPDNRSYRARYLDEVAPSGIAGRLIKFDKSGKYVTSDDGAEIAEAAEFAALCDQTVVGWQRMHWLEAAARWISFGREEGALPQTQTSMPRGTRCPKIGVSAKVETTAMSRGNAKTP